MCDYADGQIDSAEMTYAHSIDYMEKCLELGTRIWGATDALVAEQFRQLEQFQNKREKDIGY